MCGRATLTIVCVEDDHELGGKDDEQEHRLTADAGGSDRRVVAGWPAPGRGIESGNWGH